MLSTMRWTGSVGQLLWFRTGFSELLRLESVVWSGVGSPRPIIERSEWTKPSAWRSGRWKTSRRVRTVSMARSENFWGRPRLPLCLGAHSRMASSENQMVMSPRFLSDLSYSAQLVTRYFFLCLWLRFRLCAPVDAGV